MNCFLVILSIVLFSKNDTCSPFYAVVHYFDEMVNFDNRNTPFVCFEEFLETLSVKMQFSGLACTSTRKTRFFKVLNIQYNNLADIIYPSKYIISTHIFRFQPYHYFFLIYFKAVGYAPHVFVRTVIL